MFGVSVRCFQANGVFNAFSRRFQAKFVFKAFSSKISGVFGASDDSAYQRGELYKPPFANEPQDYKVLREMQERKRNELLQSPKRFQRISEREDRSDWPAQANWCQSKGKYVSRYRGFDICKCPEDFVVYHQMFDLVKPKTVIELGSLSGGMAIWMADTLKLLEIECNIYSMDLDLSNQSEVVKKLKPENVTFLQGDSCAIEKTFTKEFLARLPHPWIFIEDSHVNLDALLRYFHQHCLQGDYMVVEDTSPETSKELGMGGVVHDHYVMMGEKQLDCLRDFLEEYSDYYAVDSFLTDLFGYNGTWHWHGFIRKMK